MAVEEWEVAVAHAWASFEQLTDSEVVRRFEAISAEYPGTDGSGLFELAGAHDSTGDSEGAVPLYERALALGLPPTRRRRAIIQMASSMRNLGRAAEAAELLQQELRSPSDDLDDAVTAFLALALSDLDRDREGLALVLSALAHRLPRYQRSLANYAGSLVEGD